MAFPKRVYGVNSPSGDETALFASKHEAVEYRNNEIDDYNAWGGDDDTKATKKSFPVVTYVREEE